MPIDHLLLNSKHFNAYLVYQWLMLKRYMQEGGETQFTIMSTKYTHAHAHLHKHHPVDLNDWVAFKKAKRSVRVKG